MRNPRFPDTLLDQPTSSRLLEAIRAGMIDMAYFPGLYFRTGGETVDPAVVSDEEASRFMAIHAKIKYGLEGQVTLSRDMKLQLLQAVRSGRINLHADFPQLAQAYRAVDQDWSAITDEEQEFTLEICRRIN